MKYYIDVIVPLPIDNIFTYQVNLKEFEFIKSAHSVDDITVKIITKRPIPLLPRSLPLLHVIEPKEWKKLGPDIYAKQPIGTGPYKLVNYSPGVFKYESFKSSWRPPIIPKLEIIFTTMVFYLHWAFWCLVMCRRTAPLAGWRLLLPAACICFTANGCRTQARLSLADTVNMVN